MIGVRNQSRKGHFMEHTVKHEAASHDAFNPGELLASVERHKYLLVFIVICGLCLTGWYTRRLPLLYMSRASVLIENPSRASTTADPQLAINVEVSRAQALLAESAPVISRMLELSGDKMEPGSGSPVSPTLEARIEEQLLYLQVTDGNPERAARMSNAWAHAFVEEMTRRIEAPGVSARDFLNKSLPELRRDWIAKQEALSKFERETFFDPKEFETHPVRALVQELGLKLNSKNVELATLQAEKDMVLSKEKSPLELMQLPRVKNDPTLQAYQRQLEYLRSQLLDARVMYKADSSQVTLLEEKYQKAEEGARAGLKTLGEQITFEMSRIELERDRLGVLLKDAKIEFETLKSKAAQHKLLSSEAALAEKAYTELERRKDESDLDRGLSYSYARLWEDAQVNRMPFKPSWRKNMLTGGLGSAFAALLLIFALEFMNSSVRTAKELEQKLGVSTAGMIPAVGRRMKGFEGYFVVQRQPRSAVADSLRNVYIRLESEHSERTGEALVLTVTSAVPSDGKSFVAANLAELFASLGQTVLLIDGDTRKSSLSEAFGCDNRIGWKDLVRTGKWAPQFASPGGRTGLNILPSGKDGGRNSERLTSASTGQLLSLIKRDYDIIIIDTPPILAISDACIMARLSDMTLVVARSRRTRIYQVERATAMLKAARVTSLACVVNDVDPRDMRGETYGYHAYGYGYELSSNGADVSTGINERLQTGGVKT
jgi:capsular exopolysaccharide synthesis family protein